MRGRLRSQGECTHRQARPGSTVKTGEEIEKSTHQAGVDWGQTNGEGHFGKETSL